MFLLTLNLFSLFLFCHRISRNDSEETDTESSSHSQTGKDFEIIDKDDSDVKS